MTKYKRNVKATAEIVAKNFKSLMKNLSRDLIGLLGSTLLLIFVIVSGLLLAIDKTERA